MLVEVTVLGEGDAHADRRRATVIDALERDVHPDFVLVVEIDQEADAQPAMGPVRTRVRQWLDGLDWALERARAERGGRQPLLSVTSGDWRFHFEAWPRQAQERGADAWRGIIGPSFSAVYDHPGRLLERLDEKSRKYGELREPLLLVAQTKRMAVSQEDVDSALHGRTIGVAVPGMTRTVSTSRRSDGLWCSDGSPQRRSVPGVLVLGQELMPWTAASHQPTLWHHPDPRWPLPQLPFAALRRRDGELVRSASSFAPESLPGVDGRALGGDWPGQPWAD